MLHLSTFIKRTCKLNLAITYVQLSHFTPQSRTTVNIKMTRYTYQSIVSLMCKHTIQHKCNEKNSNH